MRCECSLFIYGGNDIDEGQLDSLWGFDLNQLSEIQETMQYGGHE